MTAIATSPLGPERTARRTSPGASWVLLSLPMLLTLALVFAVPIGCLIVLSFYSMTGPATVGDHLTASPTFSISGSCSTRSGLARSW
jgi:ABC-type sugar transport system permease subunit